MLWQWLFHSADTTSNSESIDCE